MPVLIQLVTNLIKGVLVEAILKKVVLALFKKERIISFIAGVAVMAGAAAADMQPEEIKAIICK